MVSAHSFGELLCSCRPFVYEAVNPQHTCFEGYSRQFVGLSVLSLFDFEDCIIFTFETGIYFKQLGDDLIL